MRGKVPKARSPVRVADLVVAVLGDRVAKNRPGWLGEVQRSNRPATWKTDSERFIQGYRYGWSLGGGGWEVREATSGPVSLTPADGSGKVPPVDDRRTLVAKPPSPPYATDLPPSLFRLSFFDRKGEGLD